MARRQSIASFNSSLNRLPVVGEVEEVGLSWSNMSTYLSWLSFTFCCTIHPEPCHMTSRKILPHATHHARRVQVAAAQRAECDKHARPAFKSALHSAGPTPRLRRPCIFPQPPSCRTASHLRLNPAQPCFSTTSHPLARPLPGTLGTFALYFITSISQHFILFCSFPTAQLQPYHPRATRHPIRRSGRPSTSDDRPHSIQRLHLLRLQPQRIVTALCISLPATSKQETKRPR